MVAAPVSEVADVTPLHRALAEDATCLDAGVAGSISAWQVHDRDGSLLARAASIPAADDALERVVGATPDRFFSGQIGSGGSAYAVVASSRMDARIDGRATVLEAPLLGGDVVAGDPSALLRDLHVSRLEPLTPSEAFGLPTRLPAGYRRCSGADVLASDGSQRVLYCSDDRVLELVRLTGESGDRPPARAPLGPDGADPVDVNGIHGLAGVGSDGRRIVQLEGGDLRSALYVAAPGVEVSEEQLTGVLASIPAHDPRGLSPEAGDHDLRDELRGERLREVLAAAGLRPVQSAGPVGGSFDITLASAPRAELVVFPAVDGRAATTDFLGGYPTIIELDQVDLLFSPASSRSTRGDRPGLGQAVFTCGGMVFNFLGLQDDADSTTVAAERILAQVDC
jgi:hypothetical protein